MTKILISADMEGITGVTCPDDVDPPSVKYECFRELMAGDVNAAIEGFCDAGATEIIVTDAHSSQRNIPLLSLDPRASLVLGTPKPLGMIEGIERDIDAVAFVGYHTPAGQQGILSHTNICRPLLDVTVNGKRAGEGHMNALVAAEFGVPVVLITGDHLTCEDAHSYAPSAETVAVKRCISRYSAECLAPARTGPMIREAAARALADSAPAESPRGPFTVGVEFTTTQAVTTVCLIPGVEETGERTVAFTMPTATEAYRCLRAVNMLASGSVEPVYG